MFINFFFDSYKTFLILFFMELFDIYGDKYNVILDKDINNYYLKITNFIENPELYDDSILLNILKLNYHNYGLYCSSIIKNNHELRISNKIFYKSIDLINSIGAIKILQPRELLKEINIYICNIDNLLTFLEDKHKDVLDYDYRVIQILSSLRRSNYFGYLNNLVDLNNIRLMINRIFFEYVQDLINYSNTLKRIKYDFFVTENDIKNLLLNYYDLKGNIDSILKEELVLLINNNTNKCNIKQNNGSIKYNEFIKIIETRIENI